MKSRLVIYFLLSVTCILIGFMPAKRKVVKVYLIGDSTVADYSLEADFQTKRYPLAGWGQVFQPFMQRDSLVKVKHLIKADSVVVDDRAKGGRSTRTFFEEGRWAEVYKTLQKNDVVMMQFGHNDAAQDKPERYVTIQGYKEYLRLYVNQTRLKGGLPIILTPVARNYPWQEEKLTNVHGEYPQAAKEVAQELRVHLIDLNQLSMDAFSAKGQAYVSQHYFMNLPAGVYPAYPEGQKDNTHFQPAGAKAVAGLVFRALQTLSAAK